ncbi:MAG: ATP synthase F1 subunit gamma [Bacteroidota bacterium]
MANLKEIRVRIASVKSTKQITSAMKMVSASKLRKAQNSILSLRPYAKRLQDMLDILKRRKIDDQKSPYNEVRPVENKLLIVFTANKGLCGPYNSFVLKRALKYIQESDKKSRIKLFIIGKKAYDFFKKRDVDIYETNVDLFTDNIYSNSLKLSERLMSLFVEGEFDKIDMIFNRFKNAAVQEVVCEQFLPLNNVNKKTASPESVISQAQIDDIIMEPTDKEVLNELIPKTIKTIFYRTVLDSYASEQGARMTAMHKATDNAAEVLKELSITYNKARQATITREIVEIVSGAEALNQ